MDNWTMDCISFAFRTASACIAISISTSAIAQQIPLNQASDGPAIGEIISGVAEKDERAAADFESIAQSTLQLGMAARQQGQPFPPAPVYDALQAVDEGETINPLHADWPALREQLEALLEPPPEQDQQQQSQDQNQENQDENQQGQQGGDQQNRNQEQQNQQEQQEQSDSDQEQNDGAEDQSQQNQQQGQEDQQQQGQPSSNESLGEMDEPESTPQLDQEPQKQQEETQQIGGTPEQKEPLNARQAMVRQVLDQVKKQDDPGTLHMLLQQAEEPQEQPDKPRKDW